MLISWDVETFLLGPGAVAPKLVCLSIAYREEPAGDIAHALYTNGDPALLRQAVEALFCDEDTELIAHNASFDLTVIAEAYPDLVPAILEKLEQGKIHCTKIREKLLCISSHGRLEDIEMPDGTKMRLSFSLADLVKNYLGDDRSDVKAAEDAWRLNYNKLDGKTLDEYPNDAAAYAVQDSIDTLKVYEAQAESCENDEGPRSIANEWLHVAADYALRRMTVRGLPIDLERRAAIEAELSEYLSDERMQPLVDAGILRPPEPERANKRQPGKMIAAKPSSVDKSVLGALIETVSKRIGRDIKQTPTGKTSTDDDSLQDLKDHDPLLALYAERQSVQKLVTTELPRINAERVHPDYDCLKETFRTSSFASKLYPSLNIQNIDPRVRSCFKGPFLSVDYAGIELCCLAQKVPGTLRNQINAGVDPHAFLGAQIAAALDDDFKQACAISEDQQEIYLAFQKLKATQPQFHKYYRTFAKPTGLGYPGGLGPRTFVDFAKATYGVKVDLEVATQLRELWHATYPEMREYFRWVTFECKDPTSATIRSGGDWVDGFAYYSPLGSYRAGCTYCACANGAALQTPAAEGAKIALFALERAYSLGLLRGAIPAAFIHDEVLFLLEAGADATEAAAVCEQIMVDAMRMVLPDVIVRCESKLMDRWYKEAQPVRDEQGRLLVWVPKEEELQVA